MRDFKHNIYKGSTTEVVLQTFDYMIVTYTYQTDYKRDLDSATKFANTGTVEDTKIIGCGQNSGYITPSAGFGINTAYLYQPGDDVANGLGESIVINFKNIEPIALNDNMQVELYAGWCLHPPQVSGEAASVSIRTYVGGTMTIIDQIIVSDGELKDDFPSNPFPVISGCCSTPVANKTHVATVHYNKVTKAASVVFY